MGATHNGEFVTVGRDITGDEDIFIKREITE